MSLNSAKQLGKTIAGISNNTETLNQNLSPEDPGASFPIFISESIQLTDRTLTVTRYNYTTTSFILDHVVYGELDSTILELDGGYAQIAAQPEFPWTFPATFQDGTDSTTAVGVFNF